MMIVKVSIEFHLFAAFDDGPCCHMDVAINFTTIVHAELVRCCSNVCIIARSYMHGAMNRFININCAGLEINHMNGLAPAFPVIKN